MIQHGAVAAEEDGVGNTEANESAGGHELPDLTMRLPIRGRTLGVFDPQSGVRLWLYEALLYPEPDRCWRHRVPFGLFVLFTLEAFARICVLGFLFDPEVPALSLLHIFSTTDHPFILSNEKTGPSEKSNYVNLSFRLSLEEQHDKTTCNVLYLRHSWSRTDFVAICGF